MSKRVDLYVSDIYLIPCINHYTSQLLFFDPQRFEMQDRYVCFLWECHN